MTVFCEDIIHVFPQNVQKCESILRSIKGYIFATFMFPCTSLVFGMFWSIYNINREWVLPRAADPVIPLWLNHMMHTNILVILIIEVFISNQRLPSFRSAFLGLSILSALYDVV